LRRKGKDTISPAVLIEQKALERVMSQAQEKTRAEICQDCLDRRCESGEICREFLRLSKSYAWEIVSEKAELN